MILFVRLGMIGNGLVFDGQHSFGVVNGAVPVVVVAHGAIENVIGENAVKGLALGRAGFFGFCRDINSGGNGSGTCARELPVNLDHACVACLDGTQLRVIADLGKLHVRPIDDIDQAFPACRFVTYAVDRYFQHRYPHKDLRSTFRTRN